MTLPILGFRKILACTAAIASIAALGGCATATLASRTSTRVQQESAKTLKSPRVAGATRRSLGVRREILNELANLETSAASPTLSPEKPASASGPVSAGEARSEALQTMPAPATDVPSTEPTSKTNDIEVNAAVAPETAPTTTRELARSNGSELKRLRTLENTSVELSTNDEAPLIFDIPVTYNDRVKMWVRYFQSNGRDSFRRWLERSARYLPLIQYELTRAGLPQDLVYVAMIESGFANSAVSHAGAMGMWQFIVPTGKRYGLDVDWWIDERKDFHKATRAAIRYMTDLYQQFNSWYLVAASYNMGENGVRRLIKRFGTNNFWELAEMRALPDETRDYVPKILAAMLISKAPGLYGFRDLEYQMPLSYETASVPGGIDLINLANYLGVSEKYLKELNPELIKGFIPRTVASHQIRVPKGSRTTVAEYVRMQSRSAAN